MLNAQSIGSAIVISTALLLASPTPAQERSLEDLGTCPGSAPEPAQSASWQVAFCNRTGHDIVIEFHDNDCPARNWERRGDVYQRTLHRGESKTLPVCYASEPQTKNPPPGIPTLRIPGGKGVVTTWNVVGDCGDRSKPLNLDARTFYDRGDYKTGIILLQYPGGAPHCMSDSPATAATALPPPEPAQASPAPASAPAASLAQARHTDPSQKLSPTQPPAGSAQPPGPEQAPPAAPTQALARAQPPPPPTAPQIPTTRSAPPTGSGPPSLTAVIDSKDTVGRTVWVFANGTGAPGYQCNFTLALSFTDGGSWNDRVKTNVTGAEGTAPVATRKYLKSVAKVDLNSLRCTPLPTG